MASSINEGLQEPRVYIILVNYKNWQDTVECLESIFKLSYSNFRVIVIDNDSQDSSIEHLKEWASGTESVPLYGQFYTDTNLSCKPVNKAIAFQQINPEKLEVIEPSDYKLYLAESKENLGFAGGNNIGIKLALAHQADYVWLLNNDTVIAPDTLTRLQSYFEKASKAKRRPGIIGAKLLYYHNPKLVQAVLGRYSPFKASTQHIGLNQPADASFVDLKIGNEDYIVGASMFVSADFIQEVGLMSEEYFLYFEEIDWVKRGREKNFEIDICLDAIVYHKEGASTGGGMKDNNNKSELSDFYSIRNRLIITKKFYKKYLLSVYLSLIFVAINRIKRKQLNRIPLIIKAIKSSLSSTN